MPFSQSLAMVPQEAVACGRLYFIGVPHRFCGQRRHGRGRGKTYAQDAAQTISAWRTRRKRGFSRGRKTLLLRGHQGQFSGAGTNYGQETTMTIAVVGATGNTGRAVVKELKALGQNPVCVVRNADKAREVLGADAKTAVAELTDRAGAGKGAGRRRQRVRGHRPQSAAWSSSRTTCSMRRSKPAPNIWCGSAAAARWRRRIRNRWWAAATPRSRSGSRPAASSG